MCPIDKDIIMKKGCHEGFVGIDVSKEWIDIAVGDVCFRVEQTPRSIASAIKKIKKENPALCILESTGGYERMVLTALHKANLKAHVAHPSRVREFARAKGLLAKTDRLDAHVLSAYGHFLGDTAKIAKPDPQGDKLRDLQSRYNQLKAMRHAEACRAGCSVHSDVKKGIMKMIDFLDAQIKKLSESIQEIINGNDDLKTRQALLCSMKGIGHLTAQTLLIDLPELGSLSGKEIAALVGIAPMDRESGKKKGRSRIQQGRAPVRSALYMAALVAAYHNEVFKKFYQRLLDAGKVKKVALVAVMRKMLVILNAMVRDRTCWTSS